MGSSFTRHYILFCKSNKNYLTLQWRYQSLETIDEELLARHRNNVALLSWGSHPSTFLHAFEIDAEHHRVQRDQDTVGTQGIDPFFSQL